MKYGVIVIGAGNGGLAAAATCAKAGVRTLLLERHNIPGGSASSFRRGRFEFEPSLHELTGTGNPDDPSIVEQFFARIGAQVDFVNEKSTFRLIVPARDDDPDSFISEDGVRVKVDARMPSGVEAFSRKLDEIVPGSYESSMKALDLGRQMFAAFADLEDMDNINPVDLIRKHGKFIPDAARIVTSTVTEVLDTLGMPKRAQDIFTSYWCYMGVPNSQFDFLYFMAMDYGYVKEGAAMPRMRSHEMSLAVDKVIRDNGGEIWYNSEVTGVITKDGKPCGVVINGEKEVYADYIICNTHPNFAWNDLFEKKDIPARQLSMTNARDIACALTTVYIGLDIPKEELGLKDYSIFIAPTTDSDSQYALAKKGFGSGFCIINCMNVALPEFSPKGTCALFLTGMTFDDVMKDVKPEDYKKFKEKVALDMIETCEKALNIDIQSHIEEIEIALPPTFSRYLNTPQGTPYGYMLNLWDSMIPRTIQFEKDVPFDNFVFCGASQERGDGYGSAYHTGEKAAEYVLKKISGKK